jgi:hypothetical protein
LASEELGGTVVDIAGIAALHAAAVMDVVVVVVVVVVAWAPHVSTACAAFAAVVH